MYFLTTGRIGFREWRESDRPLAVALWGDIEVTRLIGGPFSHEQIRQRLENEIATQRLHRIQYWPIFELASGIHLGCCGLRPYPKAAKTLELGFHLRPACQGKGFAQEAALGVIDHAFRTIGIEALFAGHNPKNEKSGMLLGKLGFEYTHDEFYEPTGLQHPSYLLKRERAAR